MLIELDIITSCPANMYTYWKHSDFTWKDSKLLEVEVILKVLVNWPHLLKSTTLIRITDQSKSYTST